MYGTMIQIWKADSDARKAENQITISLLRFGTGMIALHSG
jgi:hypothetical protein